ncbi:MAG TPA: hypothetical protein VLL28_06445, partial [Hyphomicrobiaceae bacterium]|nr:hypothetical protein [Hyphomicrobiaceae bacterium]
MRSILKTMLACILLALAAAGQQLWASAAAQDAPVAPNQPNTRPITKSTSEPRIKAHPQPLSQTQSETLSLAQSAAKRTPSAVKSGAPQSQAAREPTAVPASTPQAPVVTQPMAEEAEHVARYDTAIQPARDHTLSGADASILREAMAAAAGGRLAEAKSQRDKLSDPAARKFIDWYLYRGGYGTASEIHAFLDANADWPDRSLLAQRAEEALFNSSASPAAIKAFFANGKPQTAAGHAALASAYLADRGDPKAQELAKALAQKAWIELNIPAGLEAAFLKRVGPLLSEADHKRRLDRLLFNDSRWQGERNERAAVIRRLIPLLSADEKKAAEARLAVFLRAKNSAQLLSKLPSANQDWGLAVQRAQALRRQKKEPEAWKILLAEPESPLLVKPDGWWEERRANAYAALRVSNPKMAYELVRNPGALSVNATKDAAFLAGWLALRQLGDPKLALGHFQALAEAADGPLSHAKSGYWLGRTYEALGDGPKAKENYQAAAAYFDTFHGQLARLRLDANARELKIVPPATPTPEELAHFNGSDAVLAAVIVRKAGLDVSLSRAFLYHLRNALKSEAEVAMLAHLAEALGDTQTAVRIGKAAIARGLNL